MRRISMVTCMALFAGLLLPTAVSGQTQDDKLTAQEIVTKMLDREGTAFTEGEARIKMTIQNKRGQERERIINSKAMTVDGNRWTLVTFVQPADVAGTKFLSKERPKESDLQYLYLPAAKAKRRIAGSEKNESFMGTDFTYHDMEQRDMEDAAYERLADTEHSGIPAFRIDARPTSGDSEYSKLEIWIDKRDYLPLKVYFYDKAGEHYKTMVAQRIEPKGGRLTITRMLMKNLKKGSRTILEIQKLERGKQFPKVIFDENTLER